MEKLEEQKTKYGSIIFFVVLLNAIFAVFVLAGMAYMLARITQQEYEITNHKTILRQLHAQIKIKARMTAEEDTNKQGFQKTEFAKQDENEEEKPKTKTKTKISKTRRQRTTRSTCCGSATKGLVMFNESAHVVGDGGRKEPVVSMGTNYLLTAWKKKHASGHMTYSNGFLTVGVDGYYYIYGQINYADGRSATTGYIICIQGTPVVKAIKSVISKTKKFDTSYTGGVFYIRSGQRISVRTPFKQMMYYDATRAYFGAFMIHP